MTATVPTYETISKLRVRFEILAVVYHSLAQISYWQNLLPIIGFVALRERLDVDGHGLLELLHT